MATAFPILDLVIGLVFIFFLLSIFTSSAVELILTIGRARAKILEQWLLSVFNATALDESGKNVGHSLGRSIMDHCLTTGHSSSGKATPYISAAHFVSALLDKVTIKKSDSGNFQPPPQNLDEYKKAIEETLLLSNEMKRTFLAYANDAQAAANAANGKTGQVVSNILNEVKTDMDLFRGKMEGWFDDMKDRFTDKLKRGWTIWLTALCGAIITIGANADALKIGKYLYSHQGAAGEFAQTAMSNYKNYEHYIKNAEQLKKDQDPVKKEQIDSAIQETKTIMAEIKNELPAALPFGWQEESYPQEKWYERSWQAVSNHFFGWLVMILAVMLGAPLWFDLLNKIANIRGTGPKPASRADADRKDASAS